MGQQGLGGPGSQATLRRGSEVLRAEELARGLETGVVPGEGIHGTGKPLGAGSRLHADPSERELLSVRNERHSPSVRP